MSSNSISEASKKLINEYKETFKLEKTYNKTKDEKIKVHDVPSKIAFLYEKLRNTIDYKEEHLLRKNAIERILKRRLLTEKTESDVARHIMYELIRARYLPNNEIPEKRIEDISEIIKKYTLFINQVISKKGNSEDKNEYYFNWILNIASCEIEDKIVPYKKMNATVNFASYVMEKKIKVSKNIISDEDKKVQIYISILKNVAKADNSLVRYRLFAKIHREWFFAPSEELICKLAKNIDLLTKDIERQINSPLSENFSRLIRKNLAYFTILEDAAYNNIEDIEKIFSYSFYIEDVIKETCQKKYKEAKIKLKRAAVRSILYIFITKMILAIILEIPFDKYILGNINYWAIGTNIAFPPLLMFFVVLTIKVPSKKNTRLIISGIKEMIYDKYDSPKFLMRGFLSRKSFLLKIFKLFYIIVFMISFGAIIWILKKIDFNSVSVFLFLFFLSVVSYFGLRIRRNIKELVAVEQKEGFASFVAGLFSIPILQMGQWISAKLSKINIFVFIFDFIIEAPFKTFVEILEKWIYYMTEERDKIQ